MGLACLWLLYPYLGFLRGVEKLLCRSISRAQPLHGPSLWPCLVASGTYVHARSLSEVGSVTGADQDGGITCAPACLRP